MVIEQVGIYKNLEKHAEAGGEVDGAFDKGMSDVKAGRVYSADAIEAEMKRDFCI